MIPIYIYVGSTSQPLEKRFTDHISKAKNFIEYGCSENNRLFVRMNDVGLGNWEILPLVSRGCNIKTIREVERKWIKILDADLNTYSPVTDQKEYMATYRKNNKDTIKERQAAYYGNNKDAIKEQQAAYYENNRDLVRRCVSNSQRKSLENRKYFCDVCCLACRNNYYLKKHLGTYKHFEKRMWDID